MTNQFFTEVKIDNPGWKFGYQDKLMLIGSCFTENIGNKLAWLKFQTDLNPFGIIYNPMSVSKSLKILMSDKTYCEDDLFELKSVWGSFDHHSKFSSLSKDETLSKINEQLMKSRETLKNAGYLIISFGTSWVYKHKESERIVSNCHKFPASDFERFRLSVDQIVDEYKFLLDELWSYNPGIKVLFTVSPIRHWKDGAIGNNLSKASLLLAVDYLVNEFRNNCAYFPSYELVMDELRDYRFYSEDMIHLNQVAIDYIWEKFSEEMIDKESLKLIADVTKIKKAMEHRPFNSASKEHKKFLLYNLNIIDQLTNIFPYLNLNEEKLFFEKELYSNQ